MIIRPRRYIFSALDALLEGKAKKLAGLCEKIFIFINEEEPVVPVKLVQKLQAFGKKIKWVPVEIDLQSDFQVFFSFFVGKAHEKTAQDVEFVILGANPHYDSLVRYLNTCGRSCLRLEPARAFELLEPGYDIDRQEAVPSISAEREKDLSLMEEPSGAGEGGGRDKSSDTLCSKMAADVVQRMIRSGNRPAELETLREYIRLCHKDLQGLSSVDPIIQQMEVQKEISLKGGSEVVYNF